MKPSLNKILAGDSLAAAPALLGWILCRKTPQGIIKVRIIETEAYHQDDPASHSFRGQTMRTAPMFKAGGVIYVYFTYGMHYCLNIVTGPVGRGEAVLIRAAQPLQGTDIMQDNRGLTDAKNLTNGPAKLAQALGITSTKLSGELLNKSSIWLESPTQPVKKSDIIVTPRIGIKKAVDLPWRFYIKDSPFVSGV